MTITLGASRRTIALTNSRHVVDIILKSVKADFPSGARWSLEEVDGYGLCHNVHVDAAEYEEWVNSRHDYV